MAMLNKYQFDDLLTIEKQAVRKRVQECMEKEIAPIMAKYWEKAEFPLKLGDLSVAGSTIKVSGCPWLSITASAIGIAELTRVDASCSTFILVHSCLAMLTIGIGFCGSEEHKHTYLPSFPMLQTIGCWGLT